MSSDPKFYRPDGKMLPDDHHLSTTRHKKFIVRLTVSQGEKYVGKRHTYPTHTDDLQQARRFRDRLVMKLIKEGRLTRDIVLAREDEQERYAKTLTSTHGDNP